MNIPRNIRISLSVGLIAMVAFWLYVRDSDERAEYLVKELELREAERFMNLGAPQFQQEAIRNARVSMAAKVLTSFQSINGDSYYLNDATIKNSGAVCLLFSKGSDRGTYIVISPQFDVRKGDLLRPTPEGERSAWGSWCSEVPHGKGADISGSLRDGPYHWAGVPSRYDDK